MINWRRTRAVFRKESLHIFRDSRSMIMALILPVGMLLMFGFALTLDVDRIPTLVYDQDQSPQSRQLIERFQGSRYFQIEGRVDSYGPIQAAVDRGVCLLGLVIPEDFSRNLLSGRPADVQVILDGSDSNTASIALGYSQLLLQSYSFELTSGEFNRRSGQRLINPIETRLRVWYNSELKSKNYIVPGLIAVILMIIAALLTSLTIAREWEMGTMEQLLSTPLRPAELVLGKMGAYFLLGIVDLLVALGIGILIFRVPFRGSFLFLVFTSCVFIFGTLSWGIFISASARSQLLAYQMGMVSSVLPAFLLSGFVYAIENMPRVIQVVTYAVPARYYVKILNGIFLKGAGWSVLWVEVLFLVAFAVIVFAASVRKVRQKLA